MFQTDSLVKFKYLKNSNSSVSLRWRPFCLETRLQLNGVFRFHNGLYDHEVLKIHPGSSGDQILMSGKKYYHITYLKKRFRKCADFQGRFSALS